jgi:hypothetical protein
MDTQIELCVPTLLSLLFGLAFVIFDLSGGLVYTGLVRLMMVVIFSLVLQLLCQNNLSWASWTLIVVPFLFITIMTAIVFFLVNYAEVKKISDESHSQCHHECQHCHHNRPCNCPAGKKPCEICGH